MTPDYSAFKDGPSPEDLNQLSLLAAKMFAAEQEVEVIESELKKAQERLRLLSEREIPELMAKCNMIEFRTTTGLRVKVAEDVHASISQANRLDAVKWLDDHGYGGIVKRKVFVDFNKEEQEAAERLYSTLQADFSNVGIDANVHSSTLKAFVKERLKEGSDIPLPLFGAVVFKKTRIDTKVGA